MLFVGVFVERGLCLDVLNNINCNDIYRNGTPISSTLSLFLPLITGGQLTGNLTGTSCSMTSVLANTFSGSGASPTNLNASNITTGTLSVNGSGLANLNISNATTGTSSISRGVIGTTTLSANQILIGNGSTSILLSPKFNME
jgi:hypothetical protein